MSLKAQNNGPARRLRPTALLLVLLALAVAVGRPPEAHAGDGEAAGAGWIVSIGGTLASAPSFPGTSKVGPTFMPSFDIRRADEPATFSAPDDDFSVSMLSFGGLSLGPLASLRDSRPSGALRGLPGYSSAIELGGFAEFWPIDHVIRTRVELRQGVNGGDGLTGTLAMDFVHTMDKFTFAIGPRLNLADANAMQTEFGVGAVTAALNPTLPVYEAAAGAKSAGLAGSVSYEVSPEWTATMFGGYDRLVGSAAASPITKRLDGTNQITVGVGFERAFQFP
ncbi:MipA/OmpV family protein [Roseixanthobacter pseudopolyaromaticivorans]|uniref:MipA/OmpV family protein n=1 Tax=Xanthobacteraceae TaxID=335928 RepID=UPI00372CDD87